MWAEIIERKQIQGRVAQLIIQQQTCDIPFSLSIQFNRLAWQAQWMTFHSDSPPHQSQVQEASSPLCRSGSPRHTLIWCCYIWSATPLPRCPLSWAPLSCAGIPLSVGPTLWLSRHPRRWWQTFCWTVDTWQHSGAYWCLQWEASDYNNDTCDFCREILKFFCDDILNSTGSYWR